MDCAHNEDGLKRTIKAIEKLEFTDLHIVLGVVQDKDASAVLQFLPAMAQLHFCAPRIPRAMPVQELARCARSQGSEGTSYDSVTDAVAGARDSAADSDLFVVLGSIFVAEEALA